MPIGIIGGSGLYDIDGFVTIKEVSLSTPFGEPSSTFKIGRLGDTEVVFLPRHGIPHTMPPHKVNYRANIWGLKSLEVEQIISISAVGGINSTMPPGSIVLLDQIIDMTYGARLSTFYDSDRVVHIDFTHPYCTQMRNAIIKAAQNIKLSLNPNATYICVNGPRLETAKEINFYAMIGADVVGMTAMPETALAREMEICVTGLSVVTNHAAGISGEKLTTREVVANMKNCLEQIKSLITEVLLHIPPSRKCLCKDALKDACIS